MIIRSRRGIAAAVVVALAVTAGAIAYWTTTGSGTGSATTGTNQAVTISQVGTVSGLYPGGPNQDVNFKITNPAAGNQYVSTVTATISSVVKATGAPAGTCAAADYTVTQAGTAVNQDLPTGDTSFASPKVPTIKMVNSASNQDACKNVKVNLTFTSN